MNLVTITGADDHTPVSALIDLSAEFPFVEWGILVSAKQEGSGRFPGPAWMTNFTREAGNNSMKVSMHVCGEWVRQMLRGKMDWYALPDVRSIAGRIQINTHAQEHILVSSFFDWISERNARQFIIQLDGVNDYILDAGTEGDLNVAGLFDSSHGAGLLPDVWPVPRDWRTYYGYAGGLGPENVVEQVANIELSAKKGGAPNFWIDMEGRVRTNEELDLAKVRRVLELCAPLITCALL